eukprot:6179789-Pleurochrysis_carterae.AAC.1
MDETLPTSEFVGCTRAHASPKRTSIPGPISMQYASKLCSAANAGAARLLWWRVSKVSIARSNRTLFVMCEAQYAGEPICASSKGSPVMQEITSEVHGSGGELRKI